MTVAVEKRERWAVAWGSPSGMPTVFSESPPMMVDEDLFGALTGFRYHSSPSGHKAVAADFGIYGDY